MGFGVQPKVQIVISDSLPVEVTTKKRLLCRKNWKVLRSWKRTLPSEKLPAWKDD